MPRAIPAALTPLIRSVSTYSVFTEKRSPKGDHGLGSIITLLLLYLRLGLPNTRPFLLLYCSLILAAPLLLQHVSATTADSQTRKSAIVVAESSYPPSRLPHDARTPRAYPTDLPLRPSRSPSTSNEYFLYHIAVAATIAAMLASQTTTTEAHHQHPADENVWQGLEFTVRDSLCCLANLEKHISERLRNEQSTGCIYTSSTVD